MRRALRGGMPTRLIRRERWFPTNEVPPRRNIAPVAAQQSTAEQNEALGLVIKQTYFEFFHVAGEEILLQHVIFIRKPSAGGERDMCEWTEPCYEPPLAEILADPIIRALMARDRVENDEIIELLLRIAEDETESSLVAA
jgi:hypothetical protein